ncbi:hypothetical protein [Clostridium sp.]|uniref:DUF6998 domain-containing protein n=1 Tax=Clostridium sp. TaxID=1506 RepID=UPI0026DB94C5|nr:hypothetical protein [Clostridium sp.]MDO5039070.1 hypothetical protein [Clostridium sp.]
MDSNFNENLSLIKKFFDITKELEEKNVIRSSKYLGDIAEYIVSNLYGITLCESQKNKGYDGIDKDGKRVEVKFHNAKKGTNLIMDKYDEIDDEEKFERLIIIIGPDSKIRPNTENKDTYLIYDIDDYSSGNIAKEELEEWIINKRLDCNLNEIKKY